MSYREHIESLRAQWIGREIDYKGEKFSIVGVDYNGGLEIDRPARFTKTTVIPIHLVERVHEIEIDFKGRRYAFRNCDTEGKGIAEVIQLADKGGYLQYEPRNTWLVVPGIGYGWPVTA